MEQRWIPITDRLPDSGKYVLLSFENFSLPVVGRYEVAENDEGAFYVGDDFETCSEQDLFVNAWMPLPEPYQVCAENAHTKKLQTNADRIRSMTDEELAIHMMCPNDMGLAEIECDKSDSCNCYECLLKWLRAESEE